MLTIVLPRKILKLGVILAKDTAFVCAKQGETAIKARRLFEKALKLDTEYLPPLRLMAYTYIQDIMNGWGKSPRLSMKKAEELAQKGLTINENDPGIASLWSFIYQLKGQYEESIAEGERAITLDPNFAIGFLVLALCLFASGRFEETIAKIKEAIRLHGPYYPAQYLMTQGGSYSMVGRHEEAISEYKNVLARSLKGEFPLFRAHGGLAFAYTMAGQEEKARTHAAEALKANPDYSLELVRKINRFKNQADSDRMVDALRRAGIPEHPPHKKKD